MAKLALLCLLSLLGLLALTCSATTYIVGDSSGWDISTNFDTWPQGKNFAVGDVLLFQYSSSDSVNEVTKKAFQSCNTTDVLKTYTNGNTTVILSRPGAWYFISGNKLYCLGGMKLYVNVQGNQAISPVAGPQQQPRATHPQPRATHPQPSSKRNNPVSTSAGSVLFSQKNFLVKVFFGFAATTFWLIC